MEASDLTSPARGELVAGAVLPVAPAYLSPVQADTWAEVLATIAGPWPPARCLQLELYACERSHWIEAQEDLASNTSALVIRDDKGQVKAVQASPYVQIAERARKAMTIAWLEVIGEGHQRPTLIQAFKVIDALAAGADWPGVAKAAGVPLDVIRAWTADQSPECRAFVALVKRGSNGKP